METFIERDAEEVFKEEFLEFAGYNLQRRALPDVRDGLKWSARKLIHAQMLGKLTYDKPFKKAIKSVSQAMSYSYTHGDASAYGTFIRMAKPFAYRYPLQEAKGNYGTLTNPKDHSASRYVEMRGSRVAAQLLVDLDKDTITEWEDTYDMEGQFPKVLPSKGFYGIVNGCQSIGSGMASSIPPFNLKEVNEALAALLKNPEIPVEEIICYPDFPTGATLLNSEEVKSSLIDGYGKACKIRSTIEFDQKERCFIVKELPYSTYTNTICQEIANIIEQDDNCGITDCVDYTGQKPDLRIYISKKANPTKVLKMLYKNTSLESHYGINMTMLDNGTTPRTFGWKEVLQAHIDHEKEVYRRAYEFDLRKIAARLHIVEGILIALARIEEVIAIIKSSTSSAAACENLQKNFNLSGIQAKAILDMKLSRLSHLEVEKFEKEKKDLLADKDRIEKILNTKELFEEELIKGWQDTVKKFGDARRTKVLNIEKEDDEPTEVCTLQISTTNKNNIFVSKVSSLYTQKRSGVGYKIKMKTDEYIVSSTSAESNEEILFFTQNGIFYHYSAAALPIEELIPIECLFALKENERICAITSLDKKHSKKHIIFFTKNGLMKKSLLTEYNIKKSIGVKALALDPTDEIVDVVFTDDDENIGILTETGNFILIDVRGVRPLGRVARGVKAISLNDGDVVCAAAAVAPTTKDIYSIAKSGLIKRTPISEFSIQGRGTKGAKLQKLVDGDKMVDFLPTVDESEILIASTSSCIKIKAAEVPVLSRAAQGLKSIKLKSGSSVIAIAKF